MGSGVDRSCGARHDDDVGDPGCDFVEQEGGEPCGRTPTQLLVVGMTAPDPEKGAGTQGPSATSISAKNIYPSSRSSFDSVEDRRLTVARASIAEWPGGSVTSSSAPSAL